MYSRDFIFDWQELGLRSRDAVTIIQSQFKDHQMNDSDKPKRGLYQMGSLTIFPFCILCSGWHWIQSLPNRNGGRVPFPKLQDIQQQFQCQEMYKSRTETAREQRKLFQHLGENGTTSRTNISKTGVDQKWQLIMTNPRCGALTNQSSSTNLKLAVKS